MINANCGKVKVKGMKSVVMAEYACITEALVEDLGEKDIRFAFDMGCKRGL